MPNRYKTQSLKVVSDALQNRVYLTDSLRPGRNRNNQTDNPSSRDQAHQNEHPRQTSPLTRRGSAYSYAPSRDSTAIYPTTLRHQHSLDTTCVTTTTDDSNHQFSYRTSRLSGHAFSDYARLETLPRSTENPKSLELRLIHRDRPIQLNFVNNERFTDVALFANSARQMGSHFLRAIHNCRPCHI